MTHSVEDIVALLDSKARGNIRGSAKLVFTDLATIILTEDGATLGDADADVTLSAAPEVFAAILDGSQNPMMAVMKGKLKVDGSNTRALKVSDILTR
ncbi:sterol carrier family protein [Amylibacter ulvae]|uniref:Sterol carrier family protein n=1 Tax=Paramylibacter ulvae TaxID=1651968 RepID=A0ABQ3CZA0_9RHOB|nr:SCP2 sterol-binding domain-containing protein [Amylibacter ulvae]GHA49054.1 sterol carrier family protein [Amylibacter ulvae]